MRDQSTVAEIHEQEGEIIENVDGCEGGVELDRVEQNGPAIDLDNITQVEIAMAVADKTPQRPRAQQGHEGGKPLAAQSGKLAPRIFRNESWGRSQLLRIVAQDSFERRHALVRVQQPVG